MSVETEAPAATETAEAPSDFQATLAAAMERADAAPAEEEVVEGEEAEQPEGAEAEAPAAEAAAAVVDPPKEEPKPVAPALSPEWLSEAVRLNVPREVLKFAKTNEDVQEMIVDFGDQPEPEATPPAEFPIAADDFDATDPTHRALKAMWEQNVRLDAELNAIVKGKKIENSIRENEETMRIEGHFDEGLNSLDIPDIGPRGSSVRKAVYPLFHALMQSAPGVPLQDLAKRAYYATFPDALTKQATAAQLEAIAGNQQRTLGAGPSKPPAVKPPTPRDQFLATLEAADRRARKQMQEAG